LHALTWLAETIAKVTDSRPADAGIAVRAFADAELEKVGLSACQAGVLTKVHRFCG